MADSGADISASAKLFDKSVYGGIALDEAEKSMVVGEYLTAYTALNEAKKQRRKTKKRPAKSRSR
jgi:hypothetical protein